MFSGIISRRQATTYRAQFRLNWQRFLNDNFESPEQVAFVFNVEASTARKWFSGEHAPSGHAVAMAFTFFPEETAHALTGELSGDLAAC